MSIVEAIMPTASEATPPGATLWEYRIVGIQGEATMNAQELNELGNQGWELVAVQRDKTTIVAPGSAGKVVRADSQYEGTYYYFKRAKRQM
jgi:hypothetical protein